MEDNIVDIYFPMEGIRKHWEKDIVQYLYKYKKYQKKVPRVSLKDR